MRRTSKIFIGLLASIPIAGFGCGLYAQAGFVGGQTNSSLGADTKPGDEYQLTCSYATEISGIVSEHYILRMSDGAELKVFGMKRNQVMSALERAAVMMNTPNGLTIAPRQAK